MEADDAGANEAAQTKIRGGMRRAQLLPDHKGFFFTVTLMYVGGASTLQRGIVKTMTRGVNLDKSDFTGMYAGKSSVRMCRLLIEFQM